MQNLIHLIRKIAERIAETEKRRTRLADFLKELPSGMELRRSLQPDPLNNLKIAAVDGGLVRKSLHGMDCMLARAASVCFHYSGGKLANVSYFPSRNPAPRPEIYEALSELDWNHFSSINRLKEEVGVAIACLDELEPDILLMDGMLFPHNLDRPSNSSPLHPSYTSLLQLYRELFKKAIQKKTALAGVIEDSRSIVFCEHIKSQILSNVSHKMIPDMRNLLNKTRDSNLLYLMLEKGDRSLSFPIQPPHTTDFDFPPMKTFYLKTARLDRPIKIDFLSQLTNEDSLSSILLSVSGHHQGYGLPAPLIEADNVAKLSETDMENFYSNILSLTKGAPTAMKLRRETRPF